ncbi:MAG: hypothetical protein ACYDBB_26455 [Armatimonadota bacterium]
MSADATPRFSSRPARRRWWWAAGLVLVLIGLWWWRTPTKLRVVAHIRMQERVDSEDDFWSPLGLYRLTSRYESPLIITLFGWDGKPCWTARGPEVSHNPEIRAYRFDCSPDGHVVALSLFDRSRARVLSWRDGQLLGYAHWPAAISSDAVMQVTNSGRVWIYDAPLECTPLNVCRVWAVDGRHIAFKRERLPAVRHLVGNGWSISPDGTLLAGQYGGATPGARCFTLAVRGERVIATPKANLPDFDLYHIYDGGLVLDVQNDSVLLNGSRCQPRGWEAGILSGTHGAVIHFYRLTQRNDTSPHTPVHLFQPANGQQWTIPPSRVDQWPFCATPDGRFVLVQESGLPCVLLPLTDRLSSWPAVTELFRSISVRSQLAVYERPGKLRAVFAIGSVDQNNPIVLNNDSERYGFRMSEGNVAISPDGRRVGLTLDSGAWNNRLSYLILGR